MELGLTIPLQRHLNIKHLPRGTAPDRAFCWDLHVISLHGRACLLAVHGESRYTVTRFGLDADAWRDLQGTFLSGLYENLRGSGCSQRQVRAYLDRAGAPTLTKTHGRREVAFLNRAWDDVAALDYTVDQGSPSQPFLDAAVNALPRRCAGHEGLGRSDARLRLLFARLSPP